MYMDIKQLQCSRKEKREALITYQVNTGQETWNVGVLPKINSVSWLILYMGSGEIPYLVNIFLAPPKVKIKNYYHSVLNEFLCGK